jgi:hypothetical protein
MSRIPSIPPYLDWPLAATCTILGIVALVIALVVGLS